MLSSFAQLTDKNRMTSVLAYQEEIIMINFDNKPYIYLCLQINGNTLGVKIGLFGNIYVSLSSKARQSNIQNHCKCVVIDEEQHSFLDTDEDCKIHLDTVQDQRSMRDSHFLKQAIRYVGIELLTSERLISEQKEELALPCSKLFSVEAAEKVHVCYFMKHEVLMRKWRPPDVSA